MLLVMSINPDIDKLVTAAAERAATASTKRFLDYREQDKQIAIDRAVKDALIDRDLKDHAEHLSQINSSHVRMADSLKEVQKTLSSLSDAFDQQNAVSTALTTYIRGTAKTRLSRATVFVAIVAAVAAYGGIAAILITGFSSK